MIHTVLRETHLCKMPYRAEPWRNEFNLNLIGLWWGNNVLRRTQHEHGENDASPMQQNTTQHNKIRKKVKVVRV